MTTIARENGTFVVPVALLGDAFGLTEEEIRQEMRDGEIISRTERGAEEDEGRWRLTFQRGTRAFRLIVDDAGAILSRARFPVAAGGSTKQVASGSATGNQDG